MLDESSLFHDLDLAALPGRRGVKWSKYPPDVLAAWVAEMDFPVAPVIRRALHAAVERSDLGYPPEALASGLPTLFAERAQRRWGWTLDPVLVQIIPDVIRGVELCIERFTNRGDAVLTTTPVYPPLLEVVSTRGRVLADCPLTSDAHLDLDATAMMFAHHRPRLVVMCNPHNPTGRVFSYSELRGVAEIALEHGAMLVSDEIHADLLFDGHHVPLASLGTDVEAKTITLTSASKAFNLAGLRAALMVAGSSKLAAMLSVGIEAIREPVSIMGLEASLAAWSPEGDEWLAACLCVLDSNRQLIAERLAAKVPSIGYSLPQATYLAWLDCRSMGLGRSPAAWFLREAKVAVSCGARFGTPGKGFVRLNFGTSPTILRAMLDRIIAAAEQCGSSTSKTCL
ncbi:MAG: MalY/PatB family protein [Candidatus Binatia bacterium]